jgi:hypothetical protein
MNEGGKELALRAEVRGEKKLRREEVKKLEKLSLASLVRNNSFFISFFS